MMSPTRPLLHVALCVYLLGCDTTTTQSDITDVPLPQSLEQTSFDNGSTDSNPHFPLTVDSSWEFTLQGAPVSEQVLREVTSLRETISNVQAIGLRDRTIVDGVLAEESIGWYATDIHGNVWFLGEDSRELSENGQLETVESWRAGRDGARAGIVMWANPQVGSIYYQAYVDDQELDVAEVLSTSASVDVPAGRFDSCVVVEDTSALEPGAREQKYYCRDIGFVLEIDYDTDGQRLVLIRSTANTR